jgi:hypothetical protein
MCSLWSHKEFQVEEVVDGHAGKLQSPEFKETVFLWRKAAEFITFIVKGQFFHTTHKFSGWKNKVSKKQASEQSACWNFRLYRKQEGNGRQQVSSNWLAHRTKWTPNTQRLSDTTVQTNRRQEQDNEPGPEKGHLRWSRERCGELVRLWWAENQGIWERSCLPAY